jgi:hypothetical protein
MRWIRGEFCMSFLILILVEIDVGLPTIESETVYAFFVFALRPWVSKSKICG